MTIECGMSGGDEKSCLHCGQTESGHFQNRVDQSRIFHEFDGGQSECRNGRKRTTANQRSGYEQIFHGDQ